MSKHPLTCELIMDLRVLPCNKSSQEASHLRQNLEFKRDKARQYVCNNCKQSALNKLKKGKIYDLHNFPHNETHNFLIIELFVPTNALRQFFHCFLYYKDAPIRMSAVILPSSGGIICEFFFYIDQFFGFVITVSQ
jgi:hypothetical protein